MTPKRWALRIAMITSLGLVMSIGWWWWEGGGNLKSDLYSIWHLRHQVAWTEDALFRKPSLAWRVALAIGRPVVAKTQFYDLEIETVKLEPGIGLTGGAIETLGDRLLVAMPLGQLVTITANGVVEYLDQRVPMNASEGSGFGAYFRVTDILLKEHSPGRYELFVTHIYFTGECFLFRLSSTTLHIKQNNITVSPSWRTIFDVEPCLTSPSLASGGRMLADGPNHLLITVGDFKHESAKDPDSHFGKVIRAEIETGEREVFTSGHRNPQGLVRDEEGNLWATEHGPLGGDELNLLKPGRHYGWPHVTHGIDYSRKLTTGRHDGFIRPVFSWVPSIGISAVVVNDRRLFPLWTNDLLVASLWGRSHGASMFRVHRHDKKVQYVEKIEIGYQIRDMAHMQ